MNVQKNFKADRDLIPYLFFIFSESLFKEYFTNCEVLDILTLLIDNDSHYQRRIVMSVTYDVIIIGGGPSGLYSSFYAGLRDLTVCIMEAQNELGGKIAFYPEKMVWDVGGLPPTRGHQLKKYLVEQAQVFQPEIKLGVKVTSFYYENEVFHVEDQFGNETLGRTLLICIGGGIISPKKLSCPIEKNLEEHISYQFPAMRHIKNKKLLVSGGGDGAVDYALEAAELGSTVTVCYRGKELKAMEAQVKKLSQVGIEVITNHSIEQVLKHQQENCLNIQMKHRETGEKKNESFDHVLVQHGYLYDSELLNNLELSLNRYQDYYLECEMPTMTNLSGVFAAGDIHYSIGKINLLAGAFQDGIQAVNQIKKYLDPKSDDYAMVSSHNDKFKEMNQEFSAS